MLDFPRILRSVSVGDEATEAGHEKLVVVLVGILGRRDGRTLMEVVLGLGIMGILTASLLLFLSLFYQAEMALSAASVNRRLLTVAASFIETQVKQEAFAGARLAAAANDFFRIEVPPGKRGGGGGASRPRYIEVRYENNEVILVRKDGGVHTVVRPVPQDMVVSDFSVVYKDAEGRMLEQPVDLSEVRTVSFEIKGYHRQDPSKRWVSKGTFPILENDGGERR